MLTLMLALLGAQEFQAHLRGPDVEPDMVSHEWYRIESQAASLGWYDARSIIFFRVSARGLQDEGSAYWIIRSHHSGSSIPEASKGDAWIDSRNCPAVHAALDIVSAVRPPQPLRPDSEVRRPAKDPEEVRYFTYGALTSVDPATSGYLNFGAPEAVLGPVMDRVVELLATCPDGSNAEPAATS